LVETSTVARVTRKLFSDQKVKSSNSLDHTRHTESDYIAPERQSQKLHI